MLAFLNCILESLLFLLWINWLCVVFHLNGFKPHLCAIGHTFSLSSKWISLAAIAWLCLNVLHQIQHFQNENSYLFPQRCFYINLPYHSKSPTLKQKPGSYPWFISLCVFLYVCISPHSTTFTIFLTSNQSQSLQLTSYGFFLIYHFSHLHPQLTINWGLHHLLSELSQSSVTWFVGLHLAWPMLLLKKDACKMKF